MAQVGSWADGVMGLSIGDRVIRVIRVHANVIFEHQKVLEISPETDCSKNLNAFIHLHLLFLAQAPLEIQGRSRVSWVWAEAHFFEPRSHGTGNAAETCVTLVLQRDILRRQAGTIAEGAGGEVLEQVRLSKHQRATRGCRGQPGSDGTSLCYPFGSHER